MNYKETLFFVGKCLTISHNKENKNLVKKMLTSGKVDWDNVVKLSTTHYVFPALYCNLKRCEFLKFLPEDLVSYMKHITDLNRERNKQIIEQAKEINEFLLSHNITPIFLKGTGNLLEGLYEDIAERMVGDIDFLVSPNNFERTINCLDKNGYFKKNNTIDNSIVNRHYPKITKENKIAAVEIHYRMISKDSIFGYKHINNNLMNIKKNIKVLSYSDQILMTSYNKQINDFGQWFKTPSLRNTYDLFLLSNIISSKKVFARLNNQYSRYINNFALSSEKLLNLKNQIINSNSVTTKNKEFVKKQLSYLYNPEKSVKNRKRWETFFKYRSRIFFFLALFRNKSHRKYLVNRIKSKLKL
ncbi:Uncharacterised nucleotidyltransferase [Tenacibaculum sp. MAR_2009_124]|uniref:nucleotidyltransferase family protein n=1 Tax=Tenacibaculum sp. MAR_2009_124 TaxID=1250059 RepID=UPI0008974CCC|nr:nucleotidyltransferase family protein [Tenacibaculum sp. MAR_2009_124]SEB77071.1 Uncharacterised nucleotidyltransferase [Tenacibaculum sp. MAR_2009_124]